MEEPLTPNPKQNPVSTTTRIQAPTSPFFLGSNDDRLEREQARAARVAASRRKSVVFARGPQQPEKESDPCFDKQQILELFQNCIKFQKINQKNTWELNLIDHLCEIIKVEDENNAETNFQKASCTLEAGVKIYSMRVDSVHSEAYKVLGGITRAGHDDTGDNEDAAGSVGNATNQKKQTERKLISPLSTLEPSFDALNVKKFDVAFAVDPLYHQTSEQFDEGGAKGLLLNNLGVYGACQVLFDSQEIPGKLVSSANQHKSETIDLSFAKESVEQMVLNMQKDEIVPSLRAIINQFDEENQRPSDTFSCGQKTTESFDISHGNEASYADDDDGGYDNYEASFDYEGQTGAAEENFGPNDAEPAYSNFPEEVEPDSLQALDSDDRVENIDDYLFLSLGISSKQNSWAGPDHWKYRKTKIFTKALEEEMPDIFAPPKNPKSLLLPASKAPCQTKLPEDCHYQPENLVKLFLLPNVMVSLIMLCIPGETRQQNDDYEHAESWENDNVYDDGPFDNVNDQSDAEDTTNSLISQPRQVNKIEVQYDKASKQVDVQVLKETLWECLQESPQPPIEDEEHQQEPLENRSFKELLATFQMIAKRLGQPKTSHHIYVLSVCCTQSQTHWLSRLGRSNVPSCLKEK
ncbi:hypothetical protein Bca52824_028604 [Brassica carinata]|uniref:Condensin complex subunit 2 n=1 Tax=Brassica carinata TaxID=52824 RepID=A0A8X7VCS8_BRACI|nr:hypothetical protein Bca52824_028604 [Brassica carinata]